MADTAQTQRFDTSGFFSTGLDELILGNYLIEK